MLSHEAPFHELSELPMADLEACVEACMAADHTVFATTAGFFADPRLRPENAWVTFEADVRSAASTAAGRLRTQPDPRLSLIHI